MMFWFNHDVSGWGWFAMSVGMIVFWGLIITAVVFLIRTLTRAPERPGRPEGPATPRPEQLLAERFARGEIDEEEYRQRMATLRSFKDPGRDT